MPKTSRRTFLQMAPAAAALSTLGHAADGAPEPSPTTIWYREPATRWEEALAIGNGRLGAMIFGGIEKERLQLNEITVWSGRLEPEAPRNVDVPAGQARAGKPACFPTVEGSSALRGAQERLEPARHAQLAFDVPDQRR
jgi:alpha-L-fucosidase 2